MRNEHPIKVIFDTNIWISYLIGRQLGNLTELLSTRKIELVLSDQLLTELKEVTSRKKFQRYFDQQEVNELLKLMDILGTRYEVSENPNVCRDAKDDFLLGLIKASQAKFLVTGDQDLLELNPFEGTEIIEPNQLQERIDKP
ncbi:putative toxin-antitoxin system toxin component, PIN family [uncultured Roseivirga sp.]|uniref:putative toxin-antitoxin system toxin component, PIN family n=1 Tax=uncultured Roseivirga sp. TaxID=543088 RepID=UPI000D7ABD42|nr:putative toxin-antitoxin system toxin component, PIN family [uncultured Roseivirga sp.]PWL32104.1 MAG: putative toxin-antitoxin system toxin component, PIN family [Roseivirga sp. XM-24bin3]